MSADEFGWINNRFDWRTDLGAIPNRAGMLVFVMLRNQRVTIVTPIVQNHLGQYRLRDVSIDQVFAWRRAALDEAEDPGPLHNAYLIAEAGGAQCSTGGSLTHGMAAKVAALLASSQPKQELQGTTSASSGSMTTPHSHFTKLRRDRGTQWNSAMQEE